MTQKNSSLIRMLLLGAALFAGAASAQTSTSGTSTATVLSALTLSSTANLAFGDFSAGTGGTVVMSSAGARSATGGVVLGTVAANSAGAWSVGGDANKTYAITLPASATLNGPTVAAVVQTMSVGTFTSSKATGTLSAGGADTFTVGATLTVGNAQAPGSYTGTYTVTVAYN